MDKYGLRETKKPIEIELSEERIKQLDDLMKGWDFETKIFLKALLKSYIVKFVPELIFLASKFLRRKENKEFKLLSSPNKFRNWEKRFIETGKTNTKEAYNKLLKKEVSIDEAQYLLHKITEEINDVVLPEELVKLFNDIYLVHLKGEGNFGRKAPKKPFILVTGGTGSGKTETTKGLIERAIFSNEINIGTAYREEYKRISEEHPFLTSIPFLQLIKPIKELDDLKKEESAKKKRKRYKTMVKRGFFRKHFGKKVEKLKKEEKELGNKLNKDDSIKVSYETISADEIQTMWYGETGNKFRDKMGSSGTPSIRHILEAHSILGGSGNKPYDDTQAKTLSATINKIMDEIYSGERECIFIADTHSPEQIAKDTYRRFNELGVVIDISKYWSMKKYLIKLIDLEANQHNIQIDKATLVKITDKVHQIFSNKSLTITPAYVRKLISAIIKEKKDIKIEYFCDELLIRKGFENVARNIYGKLYKKIVKRPRIEDGYSWNDYEGNVKDDFLESVSSTLFRGGSNKGIVLVGPPGSGKTFLTQVVGATHPEITYISASLDDLYEDGRAEQGIIKNIDGMYNVAKMLAPSLIVLNEADAVAKKRNTQQSDPRDSVTNKFLDILHGDESVKGTFTVMTTNLLNNLDSAIIRPGRLELMSVEGKLSEKEILNIVRKKMGKEPLDGDLGLKDIYTVAKNINNTPAGFVDFIRKLKRLRKIDLSVIREYKKLHEADIPKEKFDEFIKFNSKAMIRVIEVLETDTQMLTKIKKDAKILFEDKELFHKLTKDIKENYDYPLKKSHLTNAKTDLLKNPQKKAFKEFDEFLSEELSSEPQVGKIVGAGYGNNIGVIVPVNTFLVPWAGENIIVTGATKSSVLKEADPTEMTMQSAKECLALNLHYFETLFSKYKISIDPVLVIERFLKKRTIHHQLESVSYTGGGPSAGFALAINTLSVLLNIPIYNDFGITGAPGIRGTDSKKAGSSVMIGGEDKKAERVLRDLDRMFVPKKNYSTITMEHQEAYWNDGKIIIPVQDYSDVIPEVLFIKAKEHQGKLSKLNKLRIEYNKKAIFVSEDEFQNEKSKITNLEEEIKQVMEEVIVERLLALYSFYHNPIKNKFVDLKYIFKNCSS